MDSAVHMVKQGCFVLRCAALYCIILYCTVLYCAVLWCPTGGGLPVWGGGARAPPAAGAVQLRECHPHRCALQHPNAPALPQVRTLSLEPHPYALIPSFQMLPELKPRCCVRGLNSLGLVFPCGFSFCLFLFLFFSVGQGRRQGHPDHVSALHTLDTLRDFAPTPGAFPGSSGVLQGRAQQWRTAAGGRRYSDTP